MAVQLLWQMQIKKDSSNRSYDNQREVSGKNIGDFSYYRYHKSLTNADRTYCALIQYSCWMFDFPSKAISIVLYMNLSINWQTSCFLGFEQADIIVKKPLHNQNTIMVYTVSKCRISPLFCQEWWWKSVIVIKDLYLGKEKKVIYQWVNLCSTNFLIQTCVQKHKTKFVGPMTFNAQVKLFFNQYNTMWLI